MDFVYDGERVAEEQYYEGDTQKVDTHAGPSIHQPVLAQPYLAPPNTACGLRG